MHRVYLSLGTNLGEKETNLRNAIHEIEKGIGKVVSLSTFYTTEPWGFESTNTFLNAACGVDTLLSPMEVLLETQNIERNLGRTQKSVGGIYSDRLIDIDILLYDDLIQDDPVLTLPHPLMCKRRFVMEPLNEIAAEVIHPIPGKKMKDYL